MVKLGQKVLHRFSTLEGKVEAITEFEHGCRRISVRPSGSKDGKPYDSFVVDEPELDVIDAEETPRPKEKDRKHGARPDAGARSSIPTR